MTDNTGDMDVVGTREGYDRWASLYDGEDNPLIRLDRRTWDALVGEVAGRRVLDVGCGTGRQSLRLAERGAIVTGIDFSEGMLARAAAKPGAARVSWVRHDAEAMLPFADGAFDIIVNGLMLDHVADLAGLFGEMKRVCRAGGRIAISVMHPAMILRGVTARFTDPATGRETRPASREHTISDYVMAATAAGLRLEHLAEYRVDDALVRVSPRAAKYLHWPLLLQMRLGVEG